MLTYSTLAQTSMDNALALTIVERGLQRFQGAVRAGYGDYWLASRKDVEAGPDVEDAAGGEKTFYWATEDTEKFITAVYLLTKERGLNARDLERIGAWPQLEGGFVSELVVMTENFLAAYHAAAPKPSPFLASWQWVFAELAIVAGALGLVYVKTRD
jgi:hypothetical protein